MGWGGVGWGGLVDAYFSVQLKPNPPVCMQAVWSYHGVLLLPDLLQTNCQDQAPALMCDGGTRTLQL